MFSYLGNGRVGSWSLWLSMSIVTTVAPLADQKMMKKSSTVSLVPSTTLCFWAEAQAREVTCGLGPWAVSHIVVSLAKLSGEKSEKQEDQKAKRSKEEAKEGKGSEHWYRLLTSHLHCLAHPCIGAVTASARTLVCDAGVDGEQWSSGWCWQAATAVSTPCGAQVAIFRWAESGGARAHVVHGDRTHSTGWPGVHAPVFTRGTIGWPPGSQRWPVSVHTGHMWISHVVSIRRGCCEVGGWQRTPTIPSGTSPGGATSCGAPESARVHVRFFFQKAASVHNGLDMRKELPKASWSPYKVPTRLWEAVGNQKFSCAARPSWLLHRRFLPWRFPGDW